MTTHEHSGEWSGNLKRKKRKGILNFILNLFICGCCIGVCCRCKCKMCYYVDFNAKGSDKKPATRLDRHKQYSILTFTFSWLYFVGAIFVVPFTAQMFLNSLATATAVTIFIKRKQLFLQQFRAITAMFTPIVIFMSTYAVWSLRDTIDEDELSDTDINLYSLGLYVIYIVFIANVLCLILCLCFASVSLKSVVNCSLDVLFLLFTCAIVLFWIEYKIYILQ